MLPISALKICKEDTAAFDKFLDKVNDITSANEVNLVMTASIPAENITETMHKYIGQNL